ncbi:DNA polymerase-3 subunit epsilon [Sphingomonas jinjuensis]|uniref:DNA polymerase-3 subunit epsilon n=1 Tax=Sphingomonas jinjuensis TaxID=535907 RepID=A0A840FI19_9SPHN|nr:DNA polymerase-3 subunit epsilon [Sphingomonas jinjuensis]
MTGRPVTEQAGGIDAPDFVVVDVETSCSQVSSICQIGIVGFKDGRETFAYETLLDPCDRFSSFNTRIHGITADHVIGAPTFADAHAIIAGHLSGRITVAHSLFDKGALAAACLLHRRDPIEATWLDGVRVAKRAWPDLPSHRLNVLTRFLDLPHKHHDALSDARAAGMVIVRAMEHTGMNLAGWLAPSNPPRAKAPPPALDGPLKGERIFILGEARNGPLARRLAGEGARIMAGVGVSTTRLVISDKQPFGRFVTTHAQYRQAVALQGEGVPIAIYNEVDMKCGPSTHAAVVT